MKNKFKYYFLLISTLGLIKLHWKKYKKAEVNNALSYSEKIDFSIEQLIEALGKKENIEDCKATQMKIKIDFKTKDLVDVKKIQQLNGISGVVLQNQSITLITGNNAKYIESLIKKEI